MKFALIDIITSGPHPSRDHLLGLTICLFNGGNIEQYWRRAIANKPSQAKSVSTRRTISDCSEKAVSTFAEIAHELHALLEDATLLGHSIDFSYAMLKNHFKRIGISYRSATVEMGEFIDKLASHSDSLAKNYVSSKADSHSEDSKAVSIDGSEKLIAQAIEGLGEQRFADLWAQLTNPSSMPRKLLTQLSTLPNTPGVYLFYNAESSIPLYIGKSVHIKQRIRSHFYAFHQHSKEFRLFQTVSRIETRETAGELGALLLESRLIKTLRPIHNRRLRRRKSLWGILLSKEEPYHRLSIVAISQTTGDSSIYGSYSNRKQASTALQDLIKHYRLCPKLCDLDRSNGACFHYQLHRCMGACIQQEPMADYNQRLLSAFKQTSISQWPYQGAIAIEEYCPINGRRDFLIIDEWQHLTTVQDLSQYWAQNFQTMDEHCRDEKKIIHQYLKAHREQLTIHYMNQETAIGY